MATTITAWENKMEAFICCPHRPFWPTPTRHSPLVGMCRRTGSSRLHLLLLGCSQEWWTTTRQFGLWRTRRTSFSVCFLTFIIKFFQSLQPNWLFASWSRSIGTRHRPAFACSASCWTCATATHSASWPTVGTSRRITGNESMQMTQWKKIKPYWPCLIMGFFFGCSLVICCYLTSSQINPLFVWQYFA